MTLAGKVALNLNTTNQPFTHRITTYIVINQYILILTVLSDLL